MIRNGLAGVVMLAVALVGWSLWRQLDRPVAAVRVQGPLSEAEQHAIRQVVSGSLDQGVLTLDLAELATRIRALSWPRSVEVRRIWPATLAIRVEKESVVAAWGDGGYLNSAGKVVQLADTVLDVPALSASLATPRQAMEMYQMLQNRVSAEGLSIVALAENPLGEWLMTFDDGMTVALGNEAVTQRLSRFLVAYRSALAARRGEIAHVDARYQTGVAVRWNEPLLAAADPVSAQTGAMSVSRSGERSYNGEQGN